MSYRAFSEENVVLLNLTAVRGNSNFYAADFNAIPGLPSTWNYLVDKTAVGRHVVFPAPPVLMKLLLHWPKENYEKYATGNIVKVDNRKPLERILHICDIYFSLIKVIMHLILNK